MEVDSTTKGFLPPRMTTVQRNAITNPAVGLIIYNSTTQKINYFNGSSNSWTELGEAGAADSGASATLAFSFASTDNFMVNSNAHGGITVEVTNTGLANIPFTPSVTDITLGGASAGISIDGVSPAGAATITPGNSFTLTYDLSGIPTSDGTLTATFNFSSLSAAGSIGVDPQQTLTHSLDLNNDGDFTDTAEYSNLTYKTILSSTGAIFLDRNIGATQAPDDIGDTGSDFGNFYPWDEAQTVCPTGYRLPTKTEWETEMATFAANGGNNHIGAFNTFKGTMAGYRVTSNGLGSQATGNEGSFGYYWSSTPNSVNVWGLYFGSTGARMDSGNKALGFSVRCRKD